MRLSKAGKWCLLMSPSCFLGVFLRLVWCTLGAEPGVMLKLCSLLVAGSSMACALP